ncbi:MAG: hypothetical protein LBG43_05345 [Treponema sp.]|nr:hypothetical protein [Treponema sp.]
MNEGKPKVDCNIDNLSKILLMGVGKQGQATLGCKGFEKYGLNIIGCFDIDENIVSTEKNTPGRKIGKRGKS